MPLSWRAAGRRPIGDSTRPAQRSARAFCPHSLPRASAQPRTIFARTLRPASRASCGSRTNDRTVPKVVRINAGARWEPTRAGRKIPRISWLAKRTLTASGGRFKRTSARPRRSPVPTRRPNLSEARATGESTCGRREVRPLCAARSSSRKPRAPRPECSWITRGRAGEPTRGRQVQARRRALRLRSRSDPQNGSAAPASAPRPWRARLPRVGTALCFLLLYYEMGFVPEAVSRRQRGDTIFTRVRPRAR